MILEERRMKWLLYSTKNACESFVEIMWTRGLCRLTCFAAICIAVLQEIKRFEYGNILSVMSAHWLTRSKYSYSSNTCLLAAMILWSIRDWWCSEGRRETDPQRICSSESTLNSELALSQRETCTSNVVGKYRVEILICEKWVGCSPSGWLRLCWLTVGD